MDGERWFDQDISLLAGSKRHHAFESHCTRLKRGDPEILQQWSQNKNDKEWRDAWRLERWTEWCDIARLKWETTATREGVWRQLAQEKDARLEPFQDQRVVDKYQPPLPTDYTKAVWYYRHDHVPPLEDPRVLNALFKQVFEQAKFCTSIPGWIIKRFQLQRMKYRWVEGFICDESDRRLWPEFIRAPKEGGEGVLNLHAIVYQLRRIEAVQAAVNRGDFDSRAERLREVDEDHKRMWDAFNCPKRWELVEEITAVNEMLKEEPNLQHVVGPVMDRAEVEENLAKGIQPFVVCRTIGERQEIIERHRVAWVDREIITMHAHNEEDTTKWMRQGSKQHYEEERQQREREKVEREKQRQTEARKIKEYLEQKAQRGAELERQRDAERARLHEEEQRNVIGITHTRKKKKRRYANDIPMFDAVTADETPLPADNAPLPVDLPTQPMADEPTMEQDKPTTPPPTDNAPLPIEPPSPTPLPILPMVNKPTIRHRHNKAKATTPLLMTDEEYGPLKKLWDAMQPCHIIPFPDSSTPWFKLKQACAEPRTRTAFKRRLLVNGSVEGWRSTPLAAL